MNYIKQHWFGMSVSIFMAYFLLVFIMVAISPQTDSLNRGFIPCSHEQTEKIMNCETNKAVCVINSVVRGNFCYMKVINKGFFDFISGKQSRPWSNYLFEPQIAQHSDDSDEYEAEIQKVLQNNPELAKNMEDLKEKNRELMERINQIKEDKQNEK